MNGDLVSDSQRIWDECEDCNGTGDCLECDSGYFEVDGGQVLCDTCQGTGSCPLCESEGAVEAE